MTLWLKHIDNILRGESTQVSAIRNGTIPIPAPSVIAMVTLLAMSYGFFMAWFAIISHPEPAYLQLVATTIKVPALFVLTLLVTFPSLYVFSTLIGSGLSVGAIFKLLLTALAVTMAVLASFGPITAFFSVTTESYGFMVVMNLLLFAVSGLLGMAFLLRTLHRISLATLNPDQAEPMSTENIGPLDHPRGNAVGAKVIFLFCCWLFIYGIVGAQMSWALRPFVGDPNLPFQWFRPRESNFFEAVAGILSTLLGIDDHWR